MIITLYEIITPSSVNIGQRKASVFKLVDGYKLQTNESLKDNLQQTRVIKSDLTKLHVKSQPNLFNALFSMAMKEVQENSVSKIYDSAFGGVNCNCFKTGKKWNYVWTRDTAYSVNLSLAYINPIRSMNSLLFKVSNKRNQSSQTSQIIQDTGTGGSWPISTDRVTWALGARELLNYLSKKEYKSFALKSYTALKNTVDTDRKVVYDKVSGLYNGEQSFLD